METESLEIIRLELKYCERCGGLWIRARGTGEIYCPACSVEMLELPAARGRRKPRLPVNHRVELKSCKVLFVVCGEAGNA
jgi:uncharacterized Zn finger protein (UPF0148 family)